VAKSTRTRRSKTSPKPYDGFPLTPHRGTGRWCKKHRGKTHYFGKLDDWQGALAKYEREWPYIIDGREPPPKDAPDYCSIGDLCDEFLNAKRVRLESRELTLRSFGDYFATCKRKVKTDPVMRAMVMLACNTGFGQSDIAGLPTSALDLDNGIVDYPRPKTGVQRRIPLWGETVDALRKAIAVRPEAADSEDADRVFLTCFGR
jgi:integrase